MALNDITGQVPSKLRKANVADINSSVSQKLSERLTVQRVSFPKPVVDGSAAATTDDAFFVTYGEMTILAARYIPHAALTANNTNYATLSVWDGTTTYASLTTQITGTGDWVDNTAEALTISTSSVADATTLRFRIQKAASGVVVPIGVLELVVAEREA